MRFPVTTISISPELTVLIDQNNCFSKSAAILSEDRSDEHNEERIELERNPHSIFFV